MILFSKSKNKDVEDIAKKSVKRTEEVLTNHKINKWMLVMKLHWDIINKDFNEKVDIVEEDLEDFFLEILPNLL